MLDNPDYVNSCKVVADEHLNAEAAVVRYCKRFAEMFANMDNAYMQARAADVKDVSVGVIGILSGRYRALDSEVPVILAADDLACEMQSARWIPAQITTRFWKNCFPAKHVML